jgi:hypothetical protein
MNTKQQFPEYSAEFEKFLEQVSENIDPRDYMTPSQREIADLPADALAEEYAEVCAKTNTRSASQRAFIRARYETESNLKIQK